MSSSSLRAAVIGCTGYIGMQCVELLDRHPNVELTALRGHTWAGRHFSEALPGSGVDMVVEDGLEVDGADVVFAALPHTVAAGAAPQWLGSGAVLIDMSADFRLRDLAAYKRWYGTPHPAPDLLARAVYGLVELGRDHLRSADLVAAPGCYPTAALLAAVPALRAQLVEPRVIVDAKSGISGAGRSPSLATHFAEVDESVRAYGVSGHRHGVEMEQHMAAAAGGPVSLTFVPHLVPMTRGILATVYLEPRPGVTTADVEGCYRDVCDANSFLRYEEAPPATKSVLGSNMAAINCTAQAGTVVVTAAIDNLVKGAAGQGIQAMNVRFGFAETAGLPSVSRWP